MLLKLLIIIVYLYISELSHLSTIGLFHYKHHFSVSIFHLSISIPINASNLSLRIFLCRSCILFSASLSVLLYLVVLNLLAHLSVLIRITRPAQFHFISRIWCRTFSVFISSNFIIFFIHLCYLNYLPFQYSLSRLYSPNSFSCQWPRFCTVSHSNENTHYKPEPFLNNLLFVRIFLLMLGGTFSILELFCSLLPFLV